MSNKTLIYMHIPKCGGTTLNNVLENNFDEDKRYYVNPKNISSSKRQLGGIENKSSIRLLHGHLCYGWHKLLPKKCMYFTVIRDPIERVVSQYNYVRFRDDHSHYLSEIVNEKKMSIKDYVRSGICDEVNNGMVRLLSGVEDIVQEPYGESSIPYGTNDKTLLERALENVDRHFAFVGLQEHFDKSLLLLRERLSLDTVTYRRQNTGRRHYDKVHPDDDDREVIREYNELDIKLYRYMRTRFEEDIGSLTLPEVQETWLQFRNSAMKYYRGTQNKLRSFKQSLARRF